MSKNTKPAGSADKRQEKKAIVLGKPNANRKPIIIAATIVLLSAVGVFVSLVDRGGNPEAVATSVEDSEFVSSVSYPLSLFDDGQARHFDYRDGDITVRYFVIKSADGVVRAAFDACDVCWPAGKGYYQEGDVMVCRNCGRKFTSVRINEVQGGCNPAPLARRVQDDKLIIDVADIRSGRAYFDFSQRG